ARFANTLAMTPPLPLGEGRGEGNFKQRPALAFLLAVIAVSIVGCATTAQHGALIRAQNAFNGGAYREALGHAVRAETYEANSSPSKAEAVFLRARCHEALNERDAAIAAYQTIVREHGTTEFATKAK